MENVAHALAGLLLAEGAVALRRRRGAAPSARFGRLAYVASALANNVPDGDFVYSWITGGKLGYLLHHRGHTHTLLVAVALGLAVAAAVIAWGRRLRGGEGAGAEDARWLLGLGALGPVVHVTMDAWNVYGVHPFWPLHAGWFYGDAVFILEPFLWALGIPPILFAARSRVLRALLGLILAAGLALPWVLPAYALPSGSSRSRPSPPPSSRAAASPGARSKRGSRRRSPTPRSTTSCSRRSRRTRSASPPSPCRRRPGASSSCAAPRSPRSPR